MWEVGYLHNLGVTDKDIFPREANSWTHVHHSLLRFQKVTSAYSRCQPGPTKIGGSEGMWTERSQDVFFLSYYTSYFLFVSFILSNTTATKKRFQILLYISVEHFIKNYLKLKISR